MNRGDGRMDCPECKGSGVIWPPPTPIIERCKPCDGFGRVWPKGGPMFDCTLRLGDRIAGEIVTIATGVRARVLWQMPQKRSKKDFPETTFLGLIDDFDDHESTTPVPFPAVLGVRTVDVKLDATIKGDGAGEKGGDVIDPIIRQASAGRGDLL